MQLYLISSYTKPQARLDAIFRLKLDIVNYCLTLAEIRDSNPKHLEVLRGHVCSTPVVGNVNMHYYDMLQLIAFDTYVHNLMLSMIVGKQREGYEQFLISDDILDFLNTRKHRPAYLSCPFYYNNGKIDSLIKSSFYGRLEKDIFGHSTLIIRKDGEERFFASLRPAKPFPIFTQPFLVQGNYKKDFALHCTNFDRTYNVMKGLLNMWFGCQF